MTVAEAIAATGIIPSADYTGEELNDDFVLAIQTDASQVKENAWIVCQDHVKSHGAALNAKTSDSTYLRNGTATTKTGNQRSFSVEADRVVGDPFQDFVMSHKIVYGTGQDVVVPYVWFSIRTGKGETGQVAIIVNNDADGSAGDPAGVKLDMKAVCKPTEYTYAAE
jgi:hypothetical protein